MRSSIAPKPVIEITSNKITYFCLLDKDYLKREFIENGKSMAQIAREKGCARPTVGSALVEFGLERTSRTLQHSKGQLAYGERLVRGRVVPYKTELKTLDEIKKRRQMGASYGQIAGWLNFQKIPTKNRAKCWDRPTVYKLLKKAEGVQAPSTKN